LRRESLQQGARQINLNVVCIRWGQKFSADYVHKLYNMVQRNLTLPHRFICLTENPGDLHAGIESIELQQGFEYCWNKLELFKPANFSQQDLCLYFDLDVVITGNIDDLAAIRPQEKFTGLRDWYTRGNLCYNSSVMRFYGDYFGALNTSLIAKLKEGTVRWGREYDGYLRSDDKVVLWEGKTRYGGDQEWISRYVYPQRELKKHSFPKEWIMSYKKHGRSGLPAGCKVMVFHGFPKPHEVNNDYVKEHWR